MNFQNSLKRKYDDIKETSCKTIFISNYEKNQKYSRTNYEKKIDITLFYNNTIIENPWRYLKIKE